MIDTSLVVQSAISSFNNAALAGADFLWAAVFAAPIFAVFWMFAPQISARFRATDKNISIFTIALITAWLLVGAKYSALRDGFSAAPVLVAAMLCGCAAFFTRRVLEWNIDFTKKLPINAKWKSRTDYAIPVLIAAIAGICGAPGWAGFVLQFGAVLTGIIAGGALHRRGVAASAPQTIAAFLIFISAYCMAIQPEVFRFGQMGNLTLFHLIGLFAIAAAAIGYFAMRFVKPVGKISDIWMWRGKIFAYAAGILIAMLFIITESALMYLALCAIAAAAFAAIIRHSSASESAKIKLWANDFWILIIGIFGFLTTLPVLVCAAILMWRGEKSHMNFRELAQKFYVKITWPKIKFHRK